MNKEEFNSVVESIRGKLDESTKASTSEDFLGVMSTVGNLIDTIDNMTSEVSNLKNERDELLKVNGRLFQKIGYDKPTQNENVEEEKTNEISIDDIINSKGDFI